MSLHQKPKRCAELINQLSTACSTPSTHQFNLVHRLKKTNQQNLPLFTNAALGGWDQMEGKTPGCKWKMKRGEDSCSDKLGGVACCFSSSLASSLICPRGHPSRLELTSGRWSTGGDRWTWTPKQSGDRGCRVNIGSLLNYRTLHHSQRRCVCARSGKKDTEQT